MAMVPLNTQGKRYLAATTTATVKSSKTRVWGIQIAAGVGDSCVVELKDGGASGTSKWKMTCLTTTAGLSDRDFNLHGLTFDTDCYITMADHVNVNIQYT